MAMSPRQKFFRLGALLIAPACVRRNRRRCGPVLDAELGVDLLQMLVDGARAQPQDLRDVAIGLALAKPSQYLALARGEAEFAG